MQQVFREGIIGALLDLYENALSDLKQTINNVSDENLEKIVDSETQNPSCKSIQTILSHVLRCGYIYPTLILKHKYPGEEFVTPKVTHLNSAGEYCKAIDDMFAFNETCFKRVAEEDMWDYSKNRMEVAWGQSFDFDQIMEHAIMHIYRHRRQIRKFMKTFQS
ncbi:MAG: DinB family protein [Bacteroidetes bacterium]|nr:DinB family protein [Bacteroidota bacterium]